jgi:hypothetical protein
LEGVHPYQGGYLRRIYRRDRRPGMPIESPFIFYPCYVWSLVAKHVKLIKVVLRHRSFVNRLKKDPNRRNYTDIALTPVADDEFDSFEIFSATAAAKSAVNKVRKPEARTESLAAPFKIVP